jgi:acyl carrier protein phosphodiesterase
MIQTYLKHPMQTAVILHRAIDTFTDAHPVFRQSTKNCTRYHHYAGVIVDFLRSFSGEKLGDVFQ